MKRCRHHCTLFCCLLAAAAVLSAPVRLYSDGALLAAWEEYARSAEGRGLAAWLRCGAAEFLGGAPCRMALPRELPPFYGRLGIFVTLVRQGRVRGCYGAFDHRNDDFTAVAGEYLRGALRSDPRQEPIEASELSSTRIVVTVAGDLFPADEVETLDTRRYGVIIHGESGEMRVYVPAEVRSSGYLRDAAIAMRAVQIQGFRAVTIE